MKTISVITILLCSILFLNCNSDDRVAQLEKELKTKDSLLAVARKTQVDQVTATASPEYGIAFKKTTGDAADVVKLNIIYSFNDGDDVNETITFNSNNTEYNYHSFLSDCSKKLGTPKVTFYVLQNPLDDGPPKYKLLQPDNNPSKIAIEQDPGSAPSMLTFTIKTNQIDACTGNQPGKTTPCIALYTVEIN